MLKSVLHGTGADGLLPSRKASWSVLLSFAPPLVFLPAHPVPASCLSWRVVTSEKLECPTWYRAGAAWSSVHTLCCSPCDGVLPSMLSAGALLTSTGDSPLVLQAGRATKNHCKSRSELLCPLQTAHPEHGHLDRDSMNQVGENVLVSNIWNFFCDKLDSVFNVKGIPGCGSVQNSQRAESFKC